MRTLIACLLLGCVALAATSCGSGKPGSSGGKYVIGVVTEKSGERENWGIATENGARLAAEELKGKDGIEIELVIEDNRSSPEQSATAFTKLVNVNKVIGVLGAVASSSTLAMKPSADRDKIPLVTHASTNVSVTKDTEYVFRVCWDDNFQGGVCAAFALNHMKAKKAVIVTDSKEDYSRGLSKNFQESFTRNGGTIVGELTYQGGDKTFTSQVAKLKSLDADVVFASGYASDVALLLVAARNDGYSKPFLGGDGLDDKQFFNISGALAGSGVFLCNHAHNDDPSPKVQAFVKAYKAKFGEEPQNAMAVLAYDAIYAYHDSLKRAKAKGEVTPTSLRDALLEIKNLELATGTITMGKDHEVKKGAVVVECQSDRSMKYVTTVKAEDLK